MYRGLSLSHGLLERGRSGHTPPTPPTNDCLQCFIPAPHRPSSISAVGIRCAASALWGRRRNQRFRRKPGSGKSAFLDGPLCQRGCKTSPRPNTRRLPRPRSGAGRVRSDNAGPLVLGPRGPGLAPRDFGFCPPLIRSWQVYQKGTSSSSVPKSLAISDPPAPAPRPAAAGMLPACGCP